MLPTNFFALPSALLVFLAFTPTTTATPLPPRWPQDGTGQQVLPSEDPQPQPQPQPAPALYEPSSYLDVRPNSIVISLTSVADGGSRYFFLPIGKHITTHTTPELPLHPLSAHIVGAVDPEGAVVQPEEMAGIECAIYPSWNRKADGFPNGGKTVEDFAVRVGSADGVVDLTVGVAEDRGPVRLGSVFAGREAEAYECW